MNSHNFYRPPVIVKEGVDKRRVWVAFNAGAAIYRHEKTEGDSKTGLQSLSCYLLFKPASYQHGTKKG